LKFTSFTFLPAAMLALASCSTDSSMSQGQSSTLVSTQKGVPGGTIVQTYQRTATVTAVDPSTRKVTLAGADGKKTVFKAGPDVVNFDQIHVGDQVKATVAEQLVVFMATDAPPQNDGAATMVALAPVGAKPGGLLANTEQVTARVTAIDLQHRKA